MNRVLPAIVGALLAVLVVSSCVFVVDQRQYGLVFALGEIKRVVAEPGLYLKMPPPFQNVVFIEKRILTLDTPDADRFITSEKKNVLVDSFVKWRIVDPQKYYVSVKGDEVQAERRLSQTVNDGLRAEFGKRT
ncbi:MAG: protease modulator HflC, partial [Betaproteobacteria bacterium]|nr:protease modulator HflC [Betaproteobacteria bacterium]